MLRFVSAMLSAVLLGAGLTACSSEEEAVQSIRPALVMQPQAAHAAVEAFPGEVRARLEPELAFRIGGKVMARHVDSGSQVLADQVLAELDPEDARLQLAAMRAQVTAAQANLALAQAERQRYQTLLERNLGSRSQYESADNQFKSAAARLQQAQAELTVATNQTAYTQLRAPYAGVITQTRLEAGQVVAAGQTVLVLAAEGEREVAFSIPEQRIGQFAVGQAVSVSLWSQSAQRFPGIIRELAPMADPRSRTYAARVTFATTALAAELGQSARVHVQTTGPVELAVPLSALTREAEQPYVWVVDVASGQVQKRHVRTGAYSENIVSILSGLQPDDWVVVAGVHLLQDGQPVRPVDRSNRPVTVAVEEP